MVTASDKRISQQCAQVYVDFMLDYPHEQRALQKRLQHLLCNLGYKEEGGRRAVLNCVYLVVLSFPEAELVSRWGALIFVSAASRLPQEADPTAHQMLHVLIKKLLVRVGVAGRQRLLQLAMPWARSPKRVLHAALAECLGLFAEVPEAGDGLVQLLRTALPALGTMVRSVGAEDDDAILAQTQSEKGTPAWRVAYAAHRAFERLLAGAPASAWGHLGSASLTLGPGPAASATQGGEEHAAGGRLKQKARKRDDSAMKDEQQGSIKSNLAAPDELPQHHPAAALASLWQELLGGKDVFSRDSRHPWIIAVSLRVLESQLSHSGGMTIAQWFDKGAEGTSSAQAKKASNGDQCRSVLPLNTLDLMRALASMFGSERLELEPTLAKLTVNAARSFTTFLLRNPEYMPTKVLEKEQEEEDDVAAPGKSAGDGEDDVDAEHDDDTSDAEDLQAESAEKEGSKMEVCDGRTTQVDENRGQEEGGAADAAERQEAEGGVSNLDDKGEVVAADAKQDVEEGSKNSKEEDKEEEDDKDDEDEDKGNDDDDDDEDEQDAAAEEVKSGEIEGDRHVGPSLFEAVQPSVSDEAAAVALSVTVAAATSLTPVGAAPAANAAAQVREDKAEREGEVPAPLNPAALSAIGEPLEVLRRSRVHWLVVRLSFQARHFLARPTQHLIRLVAIFRFFTGLADTLPASWLDHILEPLLSPAYRCSAFLAVATSTLPDVKSLEDALNLSHGQQTEFLGQLAQACIDAMSRKMSDEGLGAEFARSLNKVRKAVDRQRTLRHRERRLKPVRDPQAAAQEKRAKNRRKQESKKRKVQEIIVKKKGGVGGTRAKKSRTLV